MKICRYLSFLAEGSDQGCKHGTPVDFARDIAAGNYEIDKLTDSSTNTELIGDG